MAQGVKYIVTIACDAQDTGCTHDYQGPFDTREEAEAVKDEFESFGWASAWVHEVDENGRRIR